jgi:hypothetical protein
VARGLDDVLAEHWQSNSRRRYHVFPQLIFMIACLASGLWLVWGQRDEIRYAFTENHPPVDIGDVAHVSPADLPHNAFIKLRGITEHRGMEQKLIRGIAWRHRFTYFRLLGSRGIFVEVDPDRDTIGTITQIDVSGRVVDPNHDGRYARLLMAYHDNFSSRDRAHMRVVQVGVEPGIWGRNTYLLFFTMLSLLICLTTITLPHQRQLHFPTPGYEITVMGRGETSQTKRGIRESHQQISSEETYGRVYTAWRDQHSSDES